MMSIAPPMSVLARRRAEQQVVDALVYTLRQVYVDVLDIAVLIQRVRADLAPEPALLVAAERALRLDLMDVVDPHRARAQAPRDLLCLLEVGAPDCGRQAVDRVVGDPHRLLEVGVAQHAEHRPEDLLARDAHVVRDAGEDRRLDPVALLELSAGGG